MRESIKLDKFEEFVKDFMSKFYKDSEVPKWVVDALQTVNISLNRQFKIANPFYPFFKNLNGLQSIPVQDLFLVRKGYYFNYKNSTKFVQTCSNVIQLKTKL